MKLLSILLIAASMLPVAAQAACGAITASVQNVTTDGKLNYYHIAAKVTNTGGAQASNTRQFVNVFLRNEKLDAKGVPPLAADGSFTYVYTWKRSVDAGPGTTPLTFTLDPGCGSNEVAYTLRF